MLEVANPIHQSKDSGPGWHRGQQLVEQLADVLQREILKLTSTKPLFVQELDRSAVRNPVVLHKCQDELSKQAPHQALRTLQRIVFRDMLATKEE